MKIFALLAMTFMLCGCQTFAPFGAHLSRAQAISIAKQVAAEHNQRLQDYLRPEVRFDSQTGKWEVFFQRKNNSSGFEVEIDDETGHARYVPGADIRVIEDSGLPPNNTLQPTATARSVLTGT